MGVYQRNKHIPGRGSSRYKGMEAPWATPGAAVRQPVEPAHRMWMEEGGVGR